MAEKLRPKGLAAAFAACAFTNSTPVNIGQYRLPVSLYLHHHRAPSREVAGVRLRRSGNNSWPSRPITACPKQHPLVPGLSAGLQGLQGVQAWQGTWNAVVISHWPCPRSRPHVFICSPFSASGLAGSSTFCYQYFPAPVPCLLHSQRLPTLPTLQKVD